MIRWGVFALLLDFAAFLHCSIITWWHIWNGRVGEYWFEEGWGRDPGFTIESVWDEFFPSLYFLFFLWMISIAAASLAWVNILRTPIFVGRRQAV